MPYHSRLDDRTSPATNHHIPTDTGASGDAFLCAGATMNTPAEPTPPGMPSLTDEGLARPRRFKPMDAFERKENPRYDAIRKDVANRLRKACGHLSAEEFAALVDKIVEVQLKGEKRHQ